MSLLSYLPRDLQWMILSFVGNLNTLVSSKNRDINGSICVFIEHLITTNDPYIVIILGITYFGPNYYMNILNQLYIGNTMIKIDILKVCYSHCKYSNVLNMQRKLNLSIYLEKKGYSDKYNNILCVSIDSRFNDIACLVDEIKDGKIIRSEKWGHMQTNDISCIDHSYITYFAYYPVVSFIRRMQIVRY